MIGGVRLKILVDLRRGLVDKGGEFFKVVAPSHDTEEIGVVGIIDDATVVELKFVGFGKPTLTEFVGNGQIFG